MGRQWMIERAQRDLAQQAAVESTRPSTRQRSNDRECDVRLSRLEGSIRHLDRLRAELPQQFKEALRPFPFERQMLLSPEHRRPPGVARRGCVELSRLS